MAVAAAARVGFTTAYKGNVASGVSRRGITTSSIVDTWPPLEICCGFVCEGFVATELTDDDNDALLLDTCWPSITRKVFFRF